MPANTMLVLDDAQKIDENFPRIARTVSDMRAQNVFKDYGMPEPAPYSFAPLELWYMLYNIQRRALIQQLGPQAVRAAATEEIPLLSLLSVWALNKNLFEFAPEKMQDIMAHGEIDLKALTQLPQWCVLVDLPEGFTVTHEGHQLGASCFLATVFEDLKEHVPMLRVSLRTEAGIYKNEMLWLDADSLEAGIDGFLQRVTTRVQNSSSLSEQDKALLNFDHAAEKERLTALFTPVLRLLTAVCKAQAFQDDKGNMVQVHNPEAVNTKNGRRFFPENRIHRYKLV